MTAFFTSIAVTGLMTAIAIAVARRRPPGTPLTWGEAFVAGVFVFALLLMCYGIVPDRWMRWADSELRWRSDSMGIPNPFGARWFAKGITFGGRGKVKITAQVIRDLIAVGIYGVFVGGQVFAWSWWQKRGQKKPEMPALGTSAYGRPLVRKV